MKVPEDVFQTVPEDATPEDRRYMLATVIIQAVFHACSGRDEKPGSATLGTREMLVSMAAAQAMMLAMSVKPDTTPRDPRLLAKDIGKEVAETAADLRGEHAAQLEASFR
ncbi:MAG: hypothetical protein KKE77_13915 [Alphaproteobacteria bacterium]|nr:hypothetical protein [Gammaproteobacteria bacterium]MBU2342326.1 hypothetical protein [Alphaproteobacteria bacterium]